jgi:hypothetical protein
MAIRDDFAPGEVLAAADLNDTFESKLNVAGGKVLQVVSFTTDAAFSTTSQSFVDITDLAVTITPSSASNKVLVLASVSAATNTGTSRAAIRLVRQSTAICIGAAAGSRTRATSTSLSSNNFEIPSQSVTFLDSPAATTATTYKIQIVADTGTVYNNRSHEDTDGSTIFRTASTITAMEISL